jgi:hypothetical protein
MTGGYFLITRRLGFFVLYRSWTTITQDTAVSSFVGERNRPELVA